MSITLRIVEALCKRLAKALQIKEPEAPSTWCGRSARRVLVLSAALILPAQARLETNNSMSDVWERHFNNGELFAPANPDHHPDADPDGDGFTDCEEHLPGRASVHSNPHDPPW